MKILRNLYGQNLLLHCIYSAIAQYCNTISVAGLKKIALMMMMMMTETVIADYFPVTFVWLNDVAGPRRLGWFRQFHVY